MTFSTIRPLLKLSVTTLFIATILPFIAAFGELKGKRLKGCVVIENPYVIKDVTKRTGFNGIAIAYLDRLQDNLQFTIELELWEESWTTFIETMARCSPAPDSSDPCPCDIGVGSFTMTNERVEAINFVSPFSNEGHAMVSRKSDLRVDDSQSAWFVFKTFSPSVWMILIVGVFLHAVGMVFYGPFFEKANSAARRGDPLGTKSESGPRKSLLWIIVRFPVAVLYAYGDLVQHSFFEQKGGATPSFHRTAWTVLGVTTGLFMLTIYQASLTVLLFESTKDSPFRTLSDITDCNLDPSRVSMINGGASQKFWNTAVNTPENRAKCGWDADRVGLTVSNLEEGFRFVQEYKADYFYSLEGSVTFRANRNCDDFEQVGEPFFSTSVAFVMAKKANKTLLRVLSRETRILREQDAYESAELIAARNSCKGIIDPTITSGRLLAFFIMYGIIWAALLLYRIVFLWKQERERRQEQLLSSIQTE